MSIAERGEGLERMLNSDRPLTAEVQAAVDDVKRDIESSLKREVLRELDPTGDYAPPSAMNSGAQESGNYSLFNPNWDCGNAANDLVSVDLGTATVETIWLDLGSAS